MRNINAFAIFLIVAFAGCDGRTRHNTEASDVAIGVPGSDCKYVGNVPGRHFCATTYFQLLAHPERYEGRRIKVLAWAQPGGKGRIALFPTAGSLSSGEGNASIVIENDPNIPMIERFLAAGNPSQNPVPIFVSGTFTARREGPRDLGVFAYMTSIEEFGP